MKQVLLMRHAKSSWADGGMTDFERPLNKRGKRVAPNMAKFLASQQAAPELIISSPAARAAARPARRATGFVMVRGRAASPTRRGRRARA